MSMIALGGRPRGLVAGVSPTADFNIAEQLAYIEHRSGPYDAREKMILSDPWVDGFEARQKGLSLDDALWPIRKSKKRSMAGKEQLLALCEKGWRHEERTSNKD